MARIRLPGNYGPIWWNIRWNIFGSLTRKQLKVSVWNAWVRMSEFIPYSMFRYHAQSVRYYLNSGLFSNRYCTFKLLELRKVLISIVTPLLYAKLAKISRTRSENFKSPEKYDWLSHVRRCTLTGGSPSLSVHVTGYRSQRFWILVCVVLRNDSFRTLVINSLAFPHGPYCHTNGAQGLKTDIFKLMGLTHSFRDTVLLSFWYNKEIEYRKTADDTAQRTFSLLWPSNFHEGCRLLLKPTHENDDPTVSVQLRNQFYSLSNIFKFHHFMHFLSALVLPSNGRKTPGIICCIAVVVLMMISGNLWLGFHHIRNGHFQ